LKLAPISAPTDKTFTKKLKKVGKPYPVKAASIRWEEIGVGKEPSPEEEGRKPI
jgi:hypothetical protein